jgi:hypothetical protein
MSSTDYGKPEEAPETVPSSDGATVLRRFPVVAVIYAPDEASAQRRVEGAAVYLDRARLDREPAGKHHRQAEPAQS